MILAFLEELDGSGQDIPAWENRLRGKMSPAFLKNILAGVPVLLESAAHMVWKLNIGVFQFRDCN